MAYTALARRYRSRSFDEVVGQDAIARTLRHAIDRNRVAHAYLFCGTRGVGKTTMARLFAKAINCPDDKPSDVADAIMQGRDVDVVEIDAASNSKVDDARELIANSVYAPMRGPFKIYLIDEVHMLSRQAFDALLKTMEEPPAHVKFILCTTESHKVPATIQSRCQRFDFRNIPARQIAEHLRAVCAHEGVAADPGVLASIARLGEGSMRDALSLLDRLLASGEKTITPQLLADLLGLPDRDLVDAVLAAAARSEPHAALHAADELLARSVSIDQLITALIERLRDLMVISACGTDTPLVDLDGDDRSAASELASSIDAPAAVHMIALCENIQSRCKSAASPRALLDALLVRLAMTQRLADVAAILAGAPAPPAPAAVPAEKKNTERPSLTTPRVSTPTPASPPTPIALTPAQPPSASATAATPATPSAPADVWRRVVEAGATTAGARALFAGLRLESLNASEARILAATTTLARAQSKRDGIARLFADILGRPVRVEIAADDRPADAAEPSPVADARDNALRNPAVLKAQELFAARVVDVVNHNQDNTGA